jgi:hypothetical protein
MVDLATRVALGERLRDMGWHGGLLPARALVAVKAAGLLNGQAARRRPDARAGDAIDRRGDRAAH